MIHDIVTNANESIKMKIFSFIKTNDPFLDTIITTILLTLMSYFIKVLYNLNLSFDFENMNVIDKIKYTLYKKNIIIMDGKKCSGINYNASQVISSVFGTRFKAVWKEIIDGIDKNDTIHEIKDFYSDDLEDKSEKINYKNDVFIVSQKKPFLFNRELQIYALTKVTISESKSDKKESNTKTEDIEITLFSYYTSLSRMMNYIQQITDEYTRYIEESRNNKVFFYTLVNTKRDSESQFSCWKESVFDTSRSFHNIFFEDKQIVIDKLDFFLNNKDWFYSKGIPYSIGFALHGPPGTGKTSFVKCLAHYTHRHIVRLSLKLIKTQRQLHEFFFEDRYSYYNKKNSIGFSNKIIVIEDIDAQGDIVLERNRDKDINQKQNPHLFSPLHNIYENKQNKESDNMKMLTTVINQIEDPITLDDILNLWDGIEETPGRIMVITTNHYDKLDKALTRPGRIDVPVNMGNCSHEMIKDIYKHLYEVEPDMKKIKKINPYLYSPAEITNLFLSHKEDPKQFVNVLLHNKKLN